MTSPVTSPVKRQFIPIVDKENGSVHSPHKGSPKKPRSALVVDGQIPSPTKSAKRVLDLSESTPIEPSARRNLTAVFLEEPQENLEPIKLIKKRAHVPPTFNISSLLEQREKRQTFLKFDIDHWNQQAALQDQAKKRIRCMSLAAAGANHHPKLQKELLASLAIQQLEADQYNDALITCDQIDHLFPNDFTPILLIRGFCHLKLKKYEECYLFFTAAFDKSESLSDEEENITSTEWLNYAKLLSLSIDALQIAKTNAESSRDLDLTLDFLELVYLLQFTNSQFDDAIETLEEQEDFLPGSSLIEQGMCYSLLNLPEDAVEKFRSALEYRNETGLLQTQSFKFLIDVAKELKKIGQNLNDPTIFLLAAEYCDWALLEQPTQSEREEALAFKTDCELLSHSLTN